MGGGGGGGGGPAHPSVQLGVATLIKLKSSGLGTSETF